MFLRLRCACFLLPATFLPVAAAAVTIQGVDFTDPVAIAAGAARDLVLTTTEDVFVYAPNGLLGDTITLDAGLQLILVGGTSIGLSDPLLCTGGCPLDSFDLGSDVRLDVLDPVGSLEIHASGSIVVSPFPIPEPATALLLAAGAAGLSCSRRERGGARRV